MAIVLPAVPAIVEAIVAGTVVVAGALGIVVVADQVSRANERSRARPREAAPSTTCQACRNTPCAQFAGGVPGSTYRGGAHGSTKLPVGDNKDSHHMPSADASPLPRDLGPAIQMDPADHHRTGSHGTGPAAVAYRAAQRRMIAAGNFSGAFAMDVADVRAKFGSKYDGAIAQATAYMQCLKKHGIVQ